jgi:hypothetical protein
MFPGSVAARLAHEDLFLALDDHVFDTPEGLERLGVDLYGRVTDGEMSPDVFCKFLTRIYKYCIACEDPYNSIDPCYE